jgi:cytochrome bd ubiquinol oxidase subunit II
MSLADVAAAILLIGITLYAIFGGADFGAGFWDLIAGGPERGERPRALIEQSLGPVWEANHVWLIFILVISWTAFGPAFAAIMSTLFVPLALAALGIVLRGSGFAFRKAARAMRARQAAGAAFAVSSVLTPFFLGTAIGGIASGRVPAGGTAGDPLTSWLNVTGVTVGLLLVAASAYLSAVLLTVDARRQGIADLEHYFRARALGAAIVAGALAVAGLFVLHSDARYIYDGLTGKALPLVIASAIFGGAALVMLVRNASRGTRVLAAAAVTAIVWGWGLAQRPYILPKSLTIDQAAGAHDTLVAVVVVFVVAVVVVLPSLGLLYVLAQRGMVRE